MSIRIILDRAFMFLVCVFFLVMAAAIFCFWLGWVFALRDDSPFWSFLLLVVPIACMVGICATVDYHKKETNHSKGKSCTNET